MSRRERRKFTDEQTTQAVKLVRDVGSISQVAKDLDLTESALRNWVRQADIDAGNGLDGALTTKEKEGAPAPAPREQDPAHGTRALPI